MSRFLMVGVLGFVFLAGCTSKRGGEAEAPSSPARPQGVSNASLLEPLLLAEKPGNAKSVAEVKATINPGDEVVLIGTVPPDCVVPFSETRAAVILMDAGDLESEAVKTEFACPEAATCPACRKVLDDLGVRVELVGPSGTAPLKTTLQGFKGLKAGSTIIVRGKLEKDGKTHVIRATGIYVS
jgi:hypothetical protein